MTACLYKAFEIQVFFHTSQPNEEYVIKGQREEVFTVNSKYEEWLFGAVELPMAVPFTCI